MTADASTLTTSDLADFRAPRPVPACPALIVAWAIEEPERVGEVWLLSPGSPGPWHEIGRQADTLGLVRQRPGRQEVTGPLRSSRISRVQLRARAEGDAVRIDNVGRCALLRRGEPVEGTLLRVGECVELSRQLVLLCARRPARLPPAPGVSVDMPWGEADEHGIVGESPAAWALRRRIAALASTSQHVLVTGASGTGKELVAQALHRASPRGRRRLVSRNAATFPETLIDAELFGNVRDFPNPGMRDRLGLVGEADGSTLFLDEIGELRTELQAHLLRVLDQGEYQRLGEPMARRSEFVLIGATNRSRLDLRDDFLARFQTRLDLPGLTARADDIPLLARHLIRRLAADDPGVARFIEGEGASGEPRLAPSLVAALLVHPYTTHVRELALWLRSAVDAADGLDYLPLVAPVRREPAEAPPVEEVDPWSLDPAEIQAALDRCDGVQARAVRALGLKNRWVLRRLIAHYGLQVGS